ncbi:predicted protein [Nematostella vectensis]|uniref:Uncharacterized protein n=1 Tax=Nematostella vectensis TaxID=45351 RepID=A7S714_NEMVE|nr:uncharacterized protein LOC5512247 [Nematostella vectensis]EDO40526.1 predicted protein [Nematostella vectensis]|eukprot:XP_001632589.1 predicted protein [Nematostella vectensis]
MAMAANSAMARTVLTIILILAFIIMIALNGFATPNVRPAFLEPLYGNNLSTGDVSDIYSTDITPAGWAFSIWGVIYTWQVLMIIYVTSLICRKHVPDVLDCTFLGLYLLSCFLNATWIVIWQRMHLSAASVILFAISFTLYATLFVSYYRLNKIGKREFPKFDFWCVQALVHNGIAFYATWCTVASLLNMTIAVTYVHGVARATAGTIALSILAVEIIAWFVIENFVLERFLRYTISQYIVLIVALSAILYSHWKPDNVNAILTLVLLCVVCVLYLFRLVRVALKIKSERHNRSENLSLTKA